MPKYVIIGLIVVVFCFLVAKFWGNLSPKGRRRVLLVIFGLFLVSIIVLLVLLMIECGNELNLS